MNRSIRWRLVLSYVFLIALTLGAVGAIILQLVEDYVERQEREALAANAQAVARTLETGRVTYWSRSRQAFWVKGETSGHVQRLVDMRVDCDRDCLLLLVNQTGPACHTGRRNCFFTDVTGGTEADIDAG